MMRLGGPVTNKKADLTFGGLIECETDAQGMRLGQLLKEAGVPCQDEDPDPVRGRMRWQVFPVRLYDEDECSDIHVLVPNWKVIRIRQRGGYQPDLAPVYRAVQMLFDDGNVEAAKETLGDYLPVKTEGGLFPVLVRVKEKCHAIEEGQKPSRDQ